MAQLPKELTNKSVTLTLIIKYRDMIRRDPNVIFNSFLIPKMINIDINRSVNTFLLEQWHKK